MTRKQAHGQVIAIFTTGAELTKGERALPASANVAGADLADHLHDVVSLVRRNPRSAGELLERHFD